jgi:hypothetical protein
MSGRSSAIRSASWSLLGAVALPTGATANLAELISSLGPFPVPSWGQSTRVTVYFSNNRPLIECHRPFRAGWLETPERRPDLQRDAGIHLQVDVA